MSIERKVSPKRKPAKVNPQPATQPHEDVNNVEQIIKQGVTYNWSPGTIFQCTGDEFAVMFTHLESFVNGPLYQHAMNMGQLYSIVRKKLEGAIVSGIAVPITPAAGQSN